MRNFVEIEPADIDAVQKLLDENKSHPIIMERQQRNANGQPPEITRAALWASHIMCLLTTQNKSGSVPYIPVKARGREMGGQRCPNRIMKIILLIVTAPFRAARMMRLPASTCRLKTSNRPASTCLTRPGR
jgi:hypothetical protein